MQDFAGKVLIVYLVNPLEAFSGGIAIHNPVVEEIQGRVFLVGEVPPNADDWASGLRIGIGFDQVAHFLEFKDLDEYLEKSSLSVPGVGGKMFQ
jgi:hypothetical protein